MALSWCFCLMFSGTVGSRARDLMTLFSGADITIIATLLCCIVCLDAKRIINETTPSLLYTKYLSCRFSQVRVWGRYRIGRAISLENGLSCPASPHFGFSQQANRLEQY